MSTNENKNIVLRKWYEELWDGTSKSLMNSNA
jgi:hypothetical protein